MSRGVITKWPMKFVPLASSTQETILREILQTIQLLTKNAHLEEQRLLNLLEKCISQVEMALTLQPVHVSDIKDVTVCRALQTHTLLCESLERAEGQDNRVAKRGGVAKLKFKVKNSYKNVLRGIRDNPDAVTHLKPGLDTDIGKNEQLFIESLKRIYQCTLEKDQTEDRLKLMPMQVPKRKEAALDEEIASVTKAISDIDAKMNRYKAFIRDMTSQQVYEEPLSDKDDQSTSDTSKHESLQNELDQLNDQLSKLFMEDREKERSIQEGTDRVESEIEYVIDDFDEKMEETQADLEAREAELQRDEEELKRLEILFTVLEGEYNEVIARQQLAEEKMREEQRILMLKTRAAIMGQAWWRGYSVRKAIKNEAKKKAKMAKGKKK